MLRKFYSHNRPWFIWIVTGWLLCITLGSEIGLLLQPLAAIAIGATALALVMTAIEIERRRFYWYLHNKLKCDDLGNLPKSDHFDQRNKINQIIRAKKDDDEHNQRD